MGQKLEDIRPRRVSLVKRGANLRRILLAKSDEENLDGLVVDVLSAPVAKEDALLEAVAATGGDESVLKAASMAARSIDALRDAYGDKLPPEVAKAMADLADAEDTLDGGADEETEDEVAKAYESLLKEDAPTDAQRAEWAKQGIAMGDGSYYIRNRSDLEHAVHAVGRGKNNSHAAIRAHIVKRANALGATDLLPDEWNVQKEDAMSETAQAVPVKKEDGSWDLSAVPEESRDTVAAILKAHDDELEQLRKEKEAEETRAAAAERIAKSVQERIEKADYIAKAEGLDNLAKDDAEFGGLLYAVAKAEEEKHLPEGTAAKLDEVLKAANEAAAAVFKEAGRVGYTDGKDAQAKLDAAADDIRKADPKLTREQAVAKALEQKPELYDEIRKEA